MTVGGTANIATFTFRVTNQSQVIESAIIQNVPIYREPFAMNNKLFVGNLSFKLSDAELKELFEEYGTVLSCSIPTDRETGRKRGFAFIEMSTQAEAEAAIKGLNNRDIEGRQIAVSVSQPKPKGGGGRDRY